MKCWAFTVTTSLVMLHIQNTLSASTAPAAGSWNDLTPALPEYSSPSAVAAAKNAPGTRFSAIASAYVLRSMPYHLCYWALSTHQKTVERRFSFYGESRRHSSSLDWSVEKRESISMCSCGENKYNQRA